jgi:hypothetical protein
MLSDPTQFSFLFNVHIKILQSFLGTFAKLPKATISIITSVRPRRTTRLPMERFLWNLIYEDFSKIQILLKSDRNKGYFTCRPIYIFIASILFLLRVRNVSDKFVEKLKTHILCSVISFRKSCRLWDNVEKYCRAGQATNEKVAHASCKLDT